MEGGVKHFALDTALVLVALLIVGGMVTRQVNAQLPDYGFAAYQAGQGWRMTMIVLDTALPYLAWLLLFGTAVGAVHAWIVRKPTNQTTNQPDNQLSQPTAQPLLEDRQPPLFITIEEAPPEAAEEGERLSEAVRQSVLYYAREGSYKLAAQRLGKDPETIRKNCIKAKEVAPLWYATKVKE
jgi:hypothetical protein